MTRRLLMACLAVLLACAAPAAALWPRVETHTAGTRTLCLARHLEWKSEQGFTSDILEAGFERYQRIIAAIPLGVGVDRNADSNGDAEAALLQRFDPAAEAEGSAEDGAGGRRRRRCHLVRSIEVSVTSSDQSLNLETRESYTLEVSSNIMVQANSVYGALRALESLSQMLRRRELPPGSAFEAAVPAEAVWPAEGGREAGGGSDVERRHRRDKTVLLVDEVDIYDAPRFRYRGLLIDTARHYLPLSVIKTHLDAMAMVKMNVLHWHLTDDQSFPWASEELPEMAARGAFAPKAVYAPADIKEVVEYARFRGVRVIPELDTPGHTQSWGKSYPELLTRCYDTASSGARRGEPAPGDQLGPINPARNETYGFLWRLVREAARTFPDPYLHLGGDEVDHECWKSNPEVQAFMRDKGFGQDYGKLEVFYLEQVIRLAASAGKAAIVWQEAYDHGVPLPPGTRVQVWKWWRDARQAAREQRQAAAEASGGINSGEAATTGVDSQRRLQMEQQGQQQGLGAEAAPTCNPAMCCVNAPAADKAWKAELQAVTKDGYDAILSAPWYLNLGGYATEDWQQYYAVDPHDFQGTTEQKDRVLGGTACAWGEYIDAVNAINRVWPRAAAVAERLWSKDADSVDSAKHRLADLRCRMLSRGIAAQSMGPGFCPGELTTRM